jgi:hypothetical protein
MRFDENILTGESFLNQELSTENNLELGSYGIIGISITAVLHLSLLFR